jgi:hypothetical protein
MKTRLLIVAVLVVAFVVWRVAVRHRDNAPADYNQTQIQNEPAPTPVQPSNNDSQTNTQLRGVLKKSSDPARGNLMLELDDSDRTVYLSSTNAYSDLLGKEVTVTYYGEISSPVVTDIKAQ